jgi:hypothetical protein
MRKPVHRRREGFASSTIPAIQLTEKILNLPPITGGPGWLGITREQGKLEAGILWGGGGVKPVSSTKVEGEKRVITRVQVQRNGPNKGMKITETISATRDGLI